MGGYTSTPWGNNTGFSVFDGSKGAFIFSLYLSGISSSAKMKLVDAECKYAIGHYHTNYGLRFGPNTELATINGSVSMYCIGKTYARSPFEELNELQENIREGIELFPR